MGAPCGTGAPGTQPFPWRPQRAAWDGEERPAARSSRSLSSMFILSNKGSGKGTWQEFSSASQEAALRTSNQEGPFAADKVQPRHFVCLDSESDTPEIQGSLVGNPSILVRTDLQSQRELDTNTDVGTAPTAVKCPVPFPPLSGFRRLHLFPALAADSRLQTGAVPSSGACRAQRLGVRPPRDPRSSGDTRKELPSPIPTGTAPPRDGIPTEGLDVPRLPGAGGTQPYVAPRWASEGWGQCHPRGGDNSSPASRARSHGLAERRGCTGAALDPLALRPGTRGKRKGQERGGQEPQPEHEPLAGSLQAPRCGRVLAQAHYIYL